VEGRPLEAELVQRAQHGDVSAYEELVREYQGIAQRVAYLITGDTAEAEDAAQSAFIKAYYALPRFRPGAPFRPWLLKIVSNEAHNRRTAAGRRRGLELRASEGGPREAAPSPEATAVARERRERLLDAVNQLPESHRLAIACRYFLGLSETEMAEALGCARGTVKSRLARALQQLREQLLAGGVETLEVGAGHE
jgi:RNA polymerase sigma-70 factor (ECF subfamily)